MDLVDDLFTHAVRLAANGERQGTEQIDFRRAVSAAYYAVFHLLTMTAAESWAVGRERHRFARLFEHGKLRSAFLALPAKLKDRLGSNALPDDQKTADTLAAVAKEFVALQQDRNSADYDNSRVWSYTEVEDVITRAHNLYLRWNTVCRTQLAESFFLDMLGGK
ncbi:MAG TPA: hypothetical protein VLY24_00420 [Bryobacteraceae bacterium]|nr:hypothetical protein [Bryobacteraceae bacterium]